MKYHGSERAKTLQSAEIEHKKNRSRLRKERNAVTMDSRPLLEVQQISPWRSVHLRQRLGLWLLPLASVVAYPTLITQFTGAINGYRDSGNPSLAAGATLLMLMAGSVPAISARALLLLRQNEAMNPLLTRCLLYLMFSAPPVYVLSILLAARTGLVQYHGAIWTSAWVMAGLVLFFSKGSSTPRAPGTELVWLRASHGAAALCLLLGFLAAHLVNHDLALWNVELHRSAMEYLRLWYRSEWVEPVLFAILVVLIATGVPLVAHHSRRSTDAFRILQMATGVYIALFLCAHLVAILGARSAGIDTDWIFATGRNGLLDGRGMLIPYYILAAFFVVLHAGCGVRIVLLKHGVAESTANRTVYSAGVVGLIVSTLIALAALGLQIQGS